MAEIKFSRVWAMPNSATFTIKPIKEMVERNIAGKEIILDPFARECKYGTITNDLNPDFKTDYHLDALDFLRMFPDNYADCVIYDPPYSLRQVSECYKGVGRDVTMETTQASWRARHLDEIARILKPNGIALCFGWNSNGVGKTRGFEMKEVLIVPHGGSKNDTICTLERKVDVDQREDKDVSLEIPQEIPYLQAAKVLREVSDAPAADVDPYAVPVIRCKDCTFGHYIDYGHMHCIHPCGLTTNMTDDFCSYAERKE